jgi:hypothetical protein
MGRKCIREDSRLVYLIWPKPGKGVGSQQNLERCAANHAGCRTRVTPRPDSRCRCQPGGRLCAFRRAFGCNCCSSFLFFLSTGCTSNTGNSYLSPNAFFMALIFDSRTCQNRKCLCYLCRRSSNWSNQTPMYPHAPARCPFLIFGNARLTSFPKFPLARGE